MNEKEQNENRRKIDEDVTQKNAEAYTKAKKREQDVTKIQTEKGMKEKIIERVTYHNGVVKSRLVGIVKDGKLIYGAKGKK